MKRRNEGIYALYKGDKFITEGTKKQIAKCIGVKVNTISYYATKAYEKLDDVYKAQKYEEVKILQDKTLNEIKRDFKAQTIITAILVILALIICFKAWDTAVKYEALKKEKQALEDITEMQRSMISDLEEKLKRLD